MVGLVVGLDCLADLVLLADLVCQVDLVVPWVLRGQASSNPRSFLGLLRLQSSLQRQHCRSQPVELFDFVKSLAFVSNGQLLSIYLLLTPCSS